LSHTSLIICRRTALNLILCSFLCFIYYLGMTKFLFVLHFMHHKSTLLSTFPDTSKHFWLLYKVFNNRVLSTILRDYIILSFLSLLCGRKGTQRLSLSLTHVHFRLFWLRRLLHLGMLYFLYSFYSFVYRLGNGEIRVVRSSGIVR
jgi:hypothetical protein